jgi:hypothetical protein
MKTSISLLIIMFLFGGINLNAQKFSIPLEGFSKQKAAYLTMEDGTLFEGTLSGFKRTKGLIETVKMKDKDGEKLKIDPSKINFMYLAPSDLAKFGAALEQINSVNNWDKENNNDIDADLMKDGYVYFEKVLTQVKKKKIEDLMLQLMNPSFSEKIKVYHDPFAKETMSLGVGGLTLVGGLDKSYYVKKENDKGAYRLYKKDYKEQFEILFGDCPDFMAKYGEKTSWSDFEEHVNAYTEMMSK